MLMTIYSFATIQNVSFLFKEEAKMNDKKEEKKNTKYGKKEIKSHKVRVMSAMRRIDCGVGTRKRRNLLSTVKISHL